MIFGKIREYEKYIIVKKSKIRYIKNPLDEDIEELFKESKKEEYGMIEKMINNFKSGDDKFNKKGEALIVSEVNNKIVGICGLNIDPANQKRGRVRRLYVLPQYRKRGIGGKLVKKIMKHSTKNFKVISVNIGEPIRPNVARFYEELGFKRYEKEKGITHLLKNN